MYTLLIIVLSAHGIATTTIPKYGKPSCETVATMLNAMPFGPVLVGDGLTIHAICVPQQDWPG